MKPTRGAIMVLLLLLAMAAPQLAATTSGSADTESHSHAQLSDTSAIDEGLALGDTGEGVAALQDYLDNYGYKRSRNWTRNTFDAETEAALKEFQGNFKLAQTGTVDHATHTLLTTPRYDERPDMAFDGSSEVDEYILYGTAWDDPNLTYAYDEFSGDLSEAAQKSAMAQALAAWSAVTPLVFTEVQMNQNPEIVISFESGNHGDGYPFDGPSGTLAHAFYPASTDPSGMTLHGDAHFDDAETWTVNIPVPGGGTDLVTVAIHEFGHSLGLGHSNNTNAIMYAFYGGANRTLHSDDIAGIQALYGSGGGGQTIDAEIVQITMSPSSTTIGNAVTGTVQVKNNGSQAASVPVTVNGPSSFVYSTTTGSIASGATTSFTFDWTPGSAGNFTLNATANLSGDSTSSNNMKTSNVVNVTNPQQDIDAEVETASASPSSITQNSGNVTITATIANNGDNNATIPVSISGPNGYSDTKNVSVGDGDSQQVTFSWPASVVGNHTFTVSTSLSGDSTPGNNSKTTNNVTVSNPPTGGNTIYISGISMTATPTGGGNYSMQTVVTIGPNAAAGSGAYMYGYWISPQNQYSFAYGYANGNGQLTLQKTTNVTGQHKFQIYYVSKAGMQYASSQNVGNPATVNVGGGAQPVVDAAVENASASPSSITQNSGNVTITATIANNGDNGASIPVSISGPNGYSDSKNVSVGDGATQQVTFTWPASVVGNHTFTVTTSLSGDSTPGNNSKTTNSVNVTAPQQSTDAEVETASASPSSITQNSGNVTITAVINNNGSATANIPVSVTGPNNWSDSTSRTLASGGSATVTFNWPASVVGNHTFTVSTSLSGDGTPVNNSKTTNSVNVSSPPTGGNTIYINGISMTATPTGGGNYSMQTVVTIGPNAAAGSGAYMYGYWISPQNQYSFAYGYANGNGQLALQKTTNVTGQHKFQIYYVSKAGKQYVSSQNVGNPATVNVGGGAQPVVDAAVENASASPSSITQNLGNVTITADITNNGDNSASIPVSISGPNGYSDSKNVSVGDGATQQVTFSWPASVVGNHTFTVTANLSGDSNSGNNSDTSNAVNVTSPQQDIDAEVETASASPSSITQNSGNVTITATIANNGDNNATIPVSISGPNGYSDSKNVSVGDGDTQQVTFSWPASVVGNHTFTVTTSLTGDGTPGNNSKTTNSVNVSSPPSGGNTIYISGISMTATPTGGGNYSMQTVVTIGPNAAAGSGAYMYGYWISPQNQYSFAYGYANGNGQLALQKTTNVTGQHKFQIYYVNKAGKQYVSSQNIGNPATVNVGGGAQSQIGFNAGIAW